MFGRSVWKDVLEPERAVDLSALPCCESLTTKRKKYMLDQFNCLPYYTNSSPLLTLAAHTSLTPVTASDASIVAPECDTTKLTPAAGHTGPHPDPSLF